MYIKYMLEGIEKRTPEFHPYDLERMKRSVKNVGGAHIRVIKKSPKKTNK